MTWELPPPIVLASSRKAWGGVGKGSRSPAGPSPGLPTPPATQPHTCSGSNSPWLFSHSPLSFRLKWRSSRWKCWGERGCGRAAYPHPSPRPCPLQHVPTLEPVQPSRAKGSWLMGTATRSTRTALPVGPGLWAPPTSAPGGCGRRKMQKLLSKSSMVQLCRVRWAASSGRPRWCWWYRTRPCGQTRHGRPPRGRGQGPGGPPGNGLAQAAGALTCFSRRRITLGSSLASWPSWGWLMSRSTSWPCNFPLRGRRLTRWATRGCGCCARPGPAREGQPSSGAQLGCLPWRADRPLTSGSRPPASRWPQAGHALHWPPPPAAGSPPPAAGQGRSGHGSAAVLRKQGLLTVPAAPARFLHRPLLPLK